jgi:hypothetical protein
MCGMMYVAYFPFLNKLGNEDLVFLGCDAYHSAFGCFETSGSDYPLTQNRISNEIFRVLSKLQNSQVRHVPWSGYYPQILGSGIQEKL